MILSLWWQLALFILSVAALPFDRRKVSGVNPWLKPIKFEISVAVYLATMAVFLSQIRGWPGATGLIGWTMGLGMIVENTLIAFQAMRGVRSHSNFDTLFDTVIFNMMGLAILFVTFATAGLLLLYLDPHAQWQWPAAVNAGVRLGLVVLIAGSLEGVVMVTRRQHTVGAPDGGDGLPLLNWSTTHGDLRIAHFFALHAVQVFPAFGFLLSRTGISESAQIALVAVLALLYSGGCWVLFRRAMRGLPAIG